MISHQNLSYPIVLFSSQIGLPVPPGFTITTECCKQFCCEKDWKQKIPSEVWEQVAASVTDIEKAMGSTFGSPTNPLLLSVRSGAAISMPVSYLRFVFFGHFETHTHLALHS